MYGGRVSQSAEATNMVMDAQPSLIKTFEVTDLEQWKTRMATRPTTMQERVQSHCIVVRGKETDHRFRCQPGKNMQIFLVRGKDVQGFPTSHRLLKENTAI